MKVNVHNPIDASQIAKGRETSQKSNETRVPQSAADSGQLDSNVQISDQARFMQVATETARGSSAVDPARLAELKKQIADGNYKVDADVLADRIVQEHLLSDFGKNNL